MEMNKKKEKSKDQESVEKIWSSEYPTLPLSQE